MTAFGADNALILGDPWFRQFVIFHDLRHHEVTDKTNNVSLGVCVRVRACARARVRVCVLAHTCCATICTF